MRRIQTNFWKPWQPWVRGDTAGLLAHTKHQQTTGRWLLRGILFRPPLVHGLQHLIRHAYCTVPPLQQYDLQCTPPSTTQQSMTLTQCHVPTRKPAYEVMVISSIFGVASCPRWWCSYISDYVRHATGTVGEEYSPSTVQQPAFAAPPMGPGLGLDHAPG